MTLSAPKRRLMAETIPRYHRYFVDAVKGKAVRDIASDEDLTPERVTQIVRALFGELLHRYGGEINAFGFSGYEVTNGDVKGLYITSLRKKPYFWISLANRLAKESVA